MKRLRSLFLFLFIVALSADALHTLQAHHDSSHCSICTLQSHTVGSDVGAANVPDVLYIPHETPPFFAGLDWIEPDTSCLYGRAPPRFC